MFRLIKIIISIVLIGAIVISAVSFFKWNNAKKNTNEVKSSITYVMKSAGNMIGITSDSDMKKSEEVYMYASAENFIEACYVTIYEILDMIGIE